MAKKIELPNGRSWPTQNAALGHFKDLLHRYANGAVVDDRFDHDDLLDLLQRYDEAITDGPPKIGVGVDCFMRRLNVREGHYATPGFWVRRADGTETDFSYIHAVRGQPKGRAKEFYDACRAAVQADLLAAKERHFELHGDADGKVPCDLTEHPVAFAEAHIDHAWPTFAQLVITFRAARGWGRDIPDGVLTLPADSQTHTLFADPADAEAFREYHHQAAVLRVVDRTANLSMAAKQRVPKIRRPVAIG